MSPSASPALIDPFGRTIDYIRLSITDRCDFRCQYCMGEEMTFLPRNKVLSLEECARLVRIFASLGVHKVRITGGEPLVRKNALWLVKQIADTPGIRTVTMTTNGSQLASHAHALYAAGLDRLNISLDSLSPERFRHITRIGDLDKVLRGIAAAQDAGFRHIRLNTVLMRGLNDHEAIDLVNFAITHALDIAFIEEMPLGEVAHAREQSQVSNQETLAILSNAFSLTPTTQHTHGPARYWQIAGTTTRIGMISPHSHNFCESCNRVRITCQGELYLCLGQENKIDLMPLLRAHPDEDATIRAAIVAAIAAKPRAHDFDIHRSTPAVVRFMSMTGG